MNSVKQVGTERGSGTVLVIGILAAVMVTLSAVTLLMHAALAATRAGVAADLAALAAADVSRGLVLPGPGGGPCQRAEEVVVRHRAALVVCEVEGAGVVRVEVAVALNFGLVELPARASARAGPPPRHLPVQAGLP